MATVTATEDKNQKTPGRRIYTVTANDGDDFTPTGIVASRAIAHYAEDPATGNPVNATVSSGVVTINCTGASAVDFIVEVFGQD